MKIRKIMYKIVSSVLNEGAYSNIILNKYLGNNVKEIDKGLITEVVYGTIRYKYTIDYIIASLVNRPLTALDADILSILRISVYQLRYLDKVPVYAILNDAVELAKEKSIGASKLVNGVLRNYTRNKDKDFLTETDFISKLAFKYSFEKWIINLLIDQYGINTIESILAGLNEVPCTTLRVNKSKKSVDEVVDVLVESGYKIQKGKVCEEALNIFKGGSIESNIAFKNGYVTVQDESAMLASKSLEIKQDDVVLDLCSAPGGKTTHIAEMLNGTGKVIAFDVHEHKINLINQNVKRLGLKNVEAKLNDSSIFNETLVDSAEKVLLDVPCSGFGIIKKKPEIKWNKDYKDIREIVKIQKNILNNGAKYVKVNGTLVYSTCTINKLENEEIISEFLKQNNNFEISEINIGNNEKFIYNKGMVTILPNDTMDGFFIARLTRVK